MIRLNNVNKYFNRKKANEIHVIDNTSLELPESGIVSILGPSGCGKTTLLNSIGGLDKVNSGDIYIDDEKITGKSSGKIDLLRNAKIGYIFQNFNLLDKETVFDNVAIALKMIGIKDKAVIKERVNYCLNAVGIYRYRNKPAIALSGGQRQRVAIARAIVKNPRIIIADEPTGNLDSANTIEVMNIIKTIAKDRLVLLVTHERKLADFYSSRIIELKDGKIVNDYNNDANQYLDYQLENKIYLKDIKKADSFASDQVKVVLYNDNEDQAANIKIVIRGGNLYINTGGRFTVVDENSNIEMLDEHYAMIDQSVYEENSFDYAACLPEGYQPKYASLFGPGTMFVKGLKNIANFKLVKKILLVGFVLASMFAFLAASSILGAVRVQEKDFMTMHRNYITVENPSKSESALTTVAALDSVDYVLPGLTRILGSIPVNDYFQTNGKGMVAMGSVTSSSKLTSDDIIYGSLPQNDKEIVIDKMAADYTIATDSAKQLGFTDVSQLVGRTFKIKNSLEYKIAGISDTSSPAIYAADSQLTYIIMNGTDASNIPYSMMGYYSADDEELVSDPTYDSASENLKDYSLATGVTMKSGRAPTNDNEVIVNYSHYGEIALNSTITSGETKLKVVGFYTSDKLNDDTYYVSHHTKYLNYISNQTTFSAYTSGDTNTAIDEIGTLGFSSESSYDASRSEYTSNIASTVRIAVIAGVVLLIISLVEMYLMLKSSFLSRIKEIGTYRAIGVKKGDIYRMFMAEVLIITCFTGIPGTVLMYYMMKALTNMADYLTDSYLVTPLVGVISFVIMLVFNLIVGLIPVFRTMRKTPAEILSRTDI